MKSSFHTRILSLLVALTLVFGMFSLEGIQVMASSGEQNETLKENEDQETTDEADAKAFEFAEIQPVLESVEDTNIIWFGRFPQSIIGINKPQTEEWIKWEATVDERDPINPWPFGKTYYNVDPIRWQILENNAEDLFLISADILDFRAFNYSPNDDFSNIPATISTHKPPESNWGSSNVRDWLNGYEHTVTVASNGRDVGKFIELPQESPPTDVRFPKLTGRSFMSDDFINPIEEAAILKTSIDGKEDKVFLLSEAEARTFLGEDNLGAKGTSAWTLANSGPRPATRNAGPTQWLLRDDASITNPSSAKVITFTTQEAPAEFRKNKKTERSGIRPALKLDPDSIVMVSKADTEKPTAMDFTVLDAQSKNKKLTFADSSLTLTVAGFEETTVLKDGDSISGTYSNATPGTKLVVTLKEKNGKTHYQPLVDIDAQNTSGTITFTPPALGSAPDATYAVKIFVEKELPPYFSDYASVPFEFSLGVTPLGEGVAPNFTSVDNMTHEQNVPFTEITPTGFAIEANGNPAPTITQTGGTLPPGLQILEGANGKARLMGKPTTAGVYTIDLKATSVAGEVTQKLVITITQTGAPTITPGTISEGEINVAYSQAFDITGIPNPTVTFTGSLPSGISWNDATKELKGTTTIEGSYPFTISAKNKFGTTEQSYTLIIKDLNTKDKPTITLSSLPDGVVGAPYGPADVKNSVTGYPNVTSIAVTDLPTGLTYDSATGKIQGTPGPGTEGTYSVQIRATNAIGTTAKGITVEISDTYVPPSISTNSLQGGKVGESFAPVVVEVAGTPAPTVTVTGLPEGLTYDPATKTISGAFGKAGIYSVVITAKSTGPNGETVETKTISITVAVNHVSPIITTTALANGQVGKGYNDTLTATGTDPITYTVTQGSIPGVSMSSVGILSGTPTTPGTYSLTITASNVAGNNSKTYSVVIKDKDGGTVNPPKPMPTKDPTVLFNPNPMEFDLNGVAQGSITVTLGDSGDKAEFTTSSNRVKLSESTTNSDTSVNVTGQTVGTDTIIVRFYDKAGVEMTQFTTTIPVTVKNSYRPQPSRPGGSGGGGGGGGGSAGAFKAGKVSSGTGTMVSDKTLWDYLLSQVPALVQNSVKNKQPYAVGNIYNAQVLTVERAKQIVESAVRHNGLLLINADILENKIVWIRMQIDPRKVENDIKLHAVINSERVQAFGKFFTNQTQGITFAHQGEAGQAVKISVRLDLSKVDVSKLYFYDYNSTTGKYRLIKNQGYYIDANGYLVFETEVLNHLIISEGVLVKK